MRIISNNIDFDLPVDFAAEFTRNNVLLTDAGEQTAPIALPGTPKNLKLIQYSNRLDAYYKPLTDLTVTVIDGLMNRQCNMGIHSANEVDGISCTLYFATGEFYSLIDKKKLAYLPLPVFKSPLFSSQTTAQRVNYLLGLLVSEYSFPSSDIFRIAPIITTQEYTWRMHKLQINGTYADEDIQGNLVLNGFEKYQYILQLLTTPTFTTEELYHFEGQYAQRLVDGNNIINLNTGYGMTPFLRLPYLLNIIFKTFGYTFDSSTMDGLPNVHYLDVVLINNVADAIYSGILDFRQLIPDILISDFLNELEKLYSGKFIVNEISKSIQFLFFKDIFSDTNVPDEDWSNYLTDNIKMGQPEFTAIVLNNTSIQTPPDTSSDKTETIDFTFMPVVSVDDYFSASALTFKQCNLRMKMAQIDGITHKNTTVVVNGKSIAENTNAQTSIILGAISGELTDSEFLDNPSSGLKVRYRRSYTFENYNYNVISKDVDGTDWNSIVEKYTTYCNFRSQSNISVTANINLPASKINFFNIIKPKLIHGQALLIEKIVETLGKKSSKVVTFRTIRAYNQSSNAVSYQAAWDDYVCEITAQIITIIADYTPGTGNWILTANGVVNVNINVTVHIVTNDDLGAITFDGYVIGIIPSGTSSSQQYMVNDIIRDCAISSISPIEYGNQKYQF